MCKDENEKTEEKYLKLTCLFIKRGGVIARKVNGKKQFSKHSKQGELEIPCSYFVSVENEITLRRFRSFLKMRCQ